MTVSTHSKQSGSSCAHFVLGAAIQLGLGLLKIVCGQQNFIFKNVICNYFCAEFYEI